MAEFSHWLHGGPVAPTGGTQGFGNWLFGAPVISDETVYSLLTEWGILIPAPPHWRASVELSAKVPTTRVRGLGGAEVRTRHAYLPRLSMRWASTLTAAQWATVLSLLQRGGDERFLVPAWCFARRGSDWVNSEVGAGLLVAWRDGWGAFEVGAEIESPEAWDFVAPAIVGRLETKAEARGPGIVECRFEVEEDADAGKALDFDGETWATGPALPDATTPKLFPFARVWQGDPDAGAAAPQVERKEIGYARPLFSEFYPHTPERTAGVDLVLDSALDCARVFRWWRDIGGDVGAHYVPLPVSVGALAEAALEGESSLTLTGEALALGVNRILALEAFGGREVVRVSAVDETSGVCTLTAPLAASWDPDDTHVSLAMLARHARPALAVSFACPEFATARLAWREVPAEVDLDESETRGETIGGAAPRAWLYRFTLDRGGSTSVIRLTSYERDLTAASASWASVPIEHGETRATAKLDRDDVRVTMETLGDISSVFLPGRHDARVSLEIFRCTVAEGEGTGSAVSQVFSGECTRAEHDGPRLRLSFAGASSVFGRRVPRVLMQPGCNNSLFDAGCGLASEDWGFTGTVAVSDGNAVTVADLVFAGGSPPSGWGFENYFALGYLQTSSARRYIIAASAELEGSDSVAVTLVSAPSVPLGVGDTVTIFPGCDGRAETCRAYDSGTNPAGKFDNFPNFLGFTRCPTKNPAFSPFKRGDSTTGKK